MKRINYIFDDICTKENFLEAYYSAIQGKRNYKDIIEFNKDLENNLDQIYNEVKSLKYKTSKYYKFNLVSGGKLREIYKLPFRDRIVQHALMKYLEPIFRKSFIRDTYSSIKERGISEGYRRVRYALRDEENTKYCLKMDIHKFYPSIDQNILIELLKDKFKDRRLQVILEDIVFSAESGVPIGNYTSQYFANYYLTPFDHWIKEVLRVKYYFRYCDDMVILHSSKEELHKILKQIKEYLATIHLELKSNWQIFPVEARSIDFLGYRFRHKYTLLRRGTKYNFIRKINNIKDLRTKAKVLGAYWGILKRADCHNLWKKYTGVKKYSELGIMTRTRVKVEEILGKLLQVYKMEICRKDGKEYLEVEAKMDDLDIKFRTYAENLIDAAHHMELFSLPVETTIIDDFGFFRFI